MDTTAGNIVFDSVGNCNFCEDFRLKLEGNFNSNENDINDKFPFEIIRFSKYCFGIENYTQI